jgi:RNA polymerase sigma-70 factor (ECF subfamily)
MSEPSPAEIKTDLPPLSEAEIRTEINALTVADQTRLIKIASNHARLKRWKLELPELLQEALCRVLEGRRTWPRDLPAIPFLIRVIESVASEHKSVRFVNEDIEIEDKGAAMRGTLAGMDVRRIIALFDDDPIAQKILMGMMDGERGEELEKECGLSQTEYESKRKKIRRRIEKLKA